MLTNPRAERVRSVRALGRRSARERAGRFVAEGPQAVREALRCAAESVIDIYVDDTGLDRYPDLLAVAGRAGVSVHAASTAVLAAMADTEHPQGLLAVCRSIDVPLAEAFSNARRVIILSNVRDPGNAGTVIRGADAAGADAVIVTADSVDIYNPKVVRSTAGSLWHLPISRGADAESVLAVARDHELLVFAADGSGTDLLPDVDLTTPHAWLMGNEAWGLPEDLRARCDRVVRVPIYGQAESLNLAMAATLCLYASAEAAR
ncbi:TrmH family RNA methyltransferase [Demetria terragena]|uniref:TrmH family RNA methyltransferase n=1 Tax=Demetria terragena TaxID=63959 RepID=UPI000372B12A|nr:RNA methyltransferase [Demetria terragena]